MSVEVGERNGMRTFRWVGSRGVGSLAIGAVCLAATAWSVRNYAAGQMFSDALQAIQERRPVSEVFDAAERTMTIAPEHLQARVTRGQALYSIGLAGDAEARAAAFSMAENDLLPSLGLNPAEGSGLLALGLIREERRPGSGLPFVQEAFRRRPGYLENAWALARLLPADSEEKRRAYRWVTKLEPKATPEVLKEIAPQAQTFQSQARFIADTPGAYRSWAWAVTDSALGMEVAKRALSKLGEDSHGEDAGYLAYYLGLQLRDRNPKEALPWFRRALIDLPQEHAVFRNYGFALLKSGLPAEAKEQFLRSIQLHADIANAAHLGVAQAEEQLGKKREALQIYRRLEKNPRLEEWVRHAARGGVVRLDTQL